MEDSSPSGIVGLRASGGKEDDRKGDNANARLVGDKVGWRETTGLPIKPRRSDGIRLPPGDKGVGDKMRVPQGEKGPGDIIWGPLMKPLSIGLPKTAMLESIGVHSSSPTLHGIEPNVALKTRRMLSSAAEFVSRDSVNDGVGVMGV